MWWTLLAFGVLVVPVLCLPRLLLYLATRWTSTVDDEPRRAAERLAKQWRERQRSLSQDGVLRLPPPDADPEP